MEEKRENSEVIFPDEWVHPAEIWPVLFDVMKEEGISHEDAVEINFLMALVMNRLTKKKMVPFDIFNMLYEDHRNLVEQIGKIVEPQEDLNSSYYLAKSHMQIYSAILYKKIGGNENE